MVPKTKRPSLVSGLLAIALPFAALSYAAGKPEKEKEEKQVVGSIRAWGTVAPANLPGLAKISFETALRAALAASPGSVIKAELEVEERTLLYSFEIVGADKKIQEVEIDAGNGQVLDID